MALTKEQVKSLIQDYQSDHDINRLVEKWGHKKAALRAILYREGVYKAGHDVKKPGKRSQPRSKFNLRLAQNIWYHLSELGLSDAELAGFLNTTTNRIGMLKSGYHLPDARELMLFGVIAKVPVDSFFDQLLLELSNESHSTTGDDTPETNEDTF